MVMRRQDYERQAPPKALHVNREIALIPSHITLVAGISTQNDGVADAVGMIVCDGTPTQHMVPFASAKELDEAITALIACRNMVWPGG